MHARNNSKNNTIKRQDRNQKHKSNLYNRPEREGSAESPERQLDQNQHRDEVPFQGAIKQIECACRLRDGTIANIYTLI